MASIHLLLSQYQPKRSQPRFNNPPPTRPPLPKSSPYFPPAAAQPVTPTAANQVRAYNSPGYLASVVGPTVLVKTRGHVLTSGEPFRYASARSLETKYARLQVRATGQRRRGGVAKGSPRCAQYGRGRTRAIPSLPQVLAQNGLPEIAPLPKGERVMLERSRLDGFYRELQTPTRVQANTRRTQVQEFEQDAKSELTQS